jgi:hypothetical protein
MVLLTRKRKTSYIYTMKKILSSLLCLSIFSINISAQDSTATKGWTSADRSDFIGDCVKTAKVNMGEDSARTYCYCMQEKLERKYPVAADAAKITADDMSTPEWKKEIKDCLTITSTWPSQERANFLTTCINSAKAGLGEQKAKNYCECMLYKIEKKYPSTAEAATITADTMQSPEFKKMIQDCLAF